MKPLKERLTVRAAPQRQARAARDVQLTIDVDRARIDPIALDVERAVAADIDRAGVVDGRL